MRNFEKKYFFKAKYFGKFERRYVIKKLTFQKSYSISVTKQGRKVADGAIVEEDMWRETSGSLKINTFSGTIRFLVSFRRSLGWKKKRKGSFYTQGRGRGIRPRKCVKHRKYK